MLDNLINDIKQNSHSHGSIPFWAWNDKLEEDELRRQIRNMHDFGAKGFFMHARPGLDTEYLSDAWFDAVNICIDEAAKLGMEAWSYDENGWPSGFAGGKVLGNEENWASYLTYEKASEFPTDEALAVYILDNNEAVRVHSLVDGYNEYHIISVKKDSSYIDILNYDVTTEFIKETHEVYKKKINPKYFGTVMPGFFTDEPQYYRDGMPWSTVIEDEFKNRFGYDILDNLLALFIDCENFKPLRYDYHMLISDLYINSFVKQIYEWCEKNGCKLTGHTAAEDRPCEQMQVCGSAMRFYEYQHIPGIDALARKEKRNDMLPRQIGSVCAQLGKKQSITETFAMCGWDTTPKELKAIADFQYALGINMMCQHLYTYSCRGQRKYDFPLHFSEYLPWQTHLKSYNDYFDNLGYVLSLGEDNIHTLVIHPIHDAFMYYRDNNLESVYLQDKKIADLEDKLAGLGIPFHYGEEEMMSRYAHIEGSKLVVGKCTYDKVIIPEVETLDSSTVKLLKEYLANGGRVVLAGKCPNLQNARTSDFAWLEANMTFEELAKADDYVIDCPNNADLSKLRTAERVIEGKRILFITNISKECHFGVTLTIKNCKGLAKVNLFTLEKEAVFGKTNADGSFTVVCNLEDSESILLVETEELAPKSAEKINACENFAFMPPKQMKFSQKPVNTFTLDMVSYSYDGINYSGKMPVVCLADMLINKQYNGDLYVRSEFDIAEVPDSLFVACEKMEYQEFKVNGTAITFEDKIFMERCIETAEVTNLLKIGKNTVEYKIHYFQRPYVNYVLFESNSPTLVNSLRLDTELADMYLFGDFYIETDADKYAIHPRNGFAYNGEFAIKKSKNEVVVNNVIKDGYPFFAGTLCTEFIHTHKENDTAILCVKGRYAVCEVWVNENYAGKLMFEDHIDLKDCLEIGKNKIELKLTNSNRNLLGPLHNINVETFFVFPSTFTGVGKWNYDDCTNPDFILDKYCFVRFGIDSE